MSEVSPPLNAAMVAAKLAGQFELRRQDYALGGAIALGFWGAPRGTVDVDVTVYLPPEKPSDCLWLLQEIGCEFSAGNALESFRDHGFCRVMYAGMRVDVFLPIIPFYQLALARRRRVELVGHPIMIWDAESLTVFKMMFFRRKDMADVEQILRTQGSEYDRDWVRAQIVAIYGSRDPRVIAWDDLVQETSANE